MSKLSSVLFLVVAFVILVSYVESESSDSSGQRDLINLEESEGPLII